MRRLSAVVSLIVVGIMQSVLMAQTDSIQVKVLDEIIITEYNYPAQKVQFLPEVKGTYIFAGKKTELINVANSNATTAIKTGRQVFAKVPGAFIYDMDGSGNQMNFATRGLDPHRSWEYNVRQNGVMTNSDIYGYPASHYSAPFEAIEKIELVRGTASLQYGAQFGGMINYITKAIDTTKALSFENITAVGSYGLFSNFTAISGKKNNFSYYAYYHKRNSDGYRDNAYSKSEAQFISLQWDASSRMKFTAEFGRSQYLYRSPGPLTDKMFNENPRQATRSRNYFSPDIYLPSFKVDVKLSDKATLSWLSSAVIGDRSSVQFIGFADARDTINASTLQYRNRQVDIDNFNSYSSELRYLQRHSFLGLSGVLTSGVRYVNNDLHRRQLGNGTTGTDFDVSVSGTGFGRDINFKTNNIAVFIENMFNLSSKLSLTPGVRLENGTSRMAGKIVYLPEDRIPLEIKHQFILTGLSAQYKFNSSTMLYAGWSQAYRPVIFADVIPGSPIEQVDDNMEDARGYNAEIGIKGKVGDAISFDLTAFQLDYNNRIGNLILKDDAGQSYVFKTNIGDSRTNGMEALINVRLLEARHAIVSIFTSTSYMDGFYKKGSLRLGSENVDISGNVLETTPQWISRNGVNAGYKKVFALLLLSYVSSSYSDALNTETPTANGAAGIVPAYTLLDFSFTIKFNRQVNLKCNLNNLTDVHYFTKRPTGYPGVGVWNSDGRNLAFTLGIKL